MKRNIVKEEKIELYAPHKEWREFPKGKAGLILCSDCNAAYYKKSWHKNLRYFKNLREDLPIKFVLCPACKMIKNKQFEGEIIVSNIPTASLENLIHLIEAFGHRAYQIDPMHRLISVKKFRAGLTITTTENQMAVQLAKKIKSAFKKVETKISYSPSPSDVVYIKISFK